MSQAFFLPTLQYWKNNCRISWICSNQKNPKISCLKKMTNFIRKNTDHGWSKETPEKMEAWKGNSTQITELITSCLVIARPILGPFWDLFLGQFWSPLPNVACFSGFHTNIFLLNIFQRSGNRLLENLINWVSLKENILEINENWLRKSHWFWSLTHLKFGNPKNNSSKKWLGFRTHLKVEVCSYYSMIAVC
jgi:hypothetical protein